MIRQLLPLVLAASVAACAGAQGGPPPGPPAAVDADAWVESTLARLTVRQKVGQLVAPWVLGDYLPAAGPEFERLRAFVVDQGVGGIIISIGPPYELAAKLNRLQELADVPLLISADMEHGPGQRLTGGVALPSALELGGGTLFPPLMGLGAAGDPRLAYELGRITALEGRAAGVHMTYAPVVDVNNNPANPIINTRSYGADPDLVARLAAAHVRGIQEHGMIATAKHFPGHGDTGTDSHIELPFILHDRARVDSLELVPFRAAIDAGVGAVMSAHIAFPALTGDSVTPATLSDEILTDLLQERLAFDGLVVTDALDMGAIVKRYGRGDAAVLALKAGADQLLMPPDVPTAIDAVVAAVERGEVSEARLDRSVRKILRLKAELGLHRRRTVDLNRLPQVVGAPAHRERAQEAADRSITLVRDSATLVPLAATPRVLSIVYADDFDPLAGRTFQRALGQRLTGMRTAFVDRRTGQAALDSLVAAADSADLVLFSPFVRVLAWKGGVAIAAPVAEFVNRLLARRPVAITAFGNPYLLSQFPSAGTYMLAWGQGDASQRAAARALFGEIPITGRLPIPLPPYHALGEGMERPQILGVSQ